VGKVVSLRQDERNKKQNPEVCIAGTTGYYSTKIAHFILYSKYFEAFLK